MLNYTDLTSGRTTTLRGKKKKAFEEELLQQVRVEVEDCEDYLETSIRPRIAENWDYYNGVLPLRREGEPSFVDNTCAATVDHYVAACMDAFTNGETLQVVPDGVTHPTTLKIINQVMNDILDNENSRHSIYHAFFTDALVSSASVMRPKVIEETRIEKEHFTDVEMGVIEMRQLQLELTRKYEDIEVVVTEIVETEVSQTQDVPTGSVLGQMEGIAINATTTTVTYTGYFVLMYKERTIKIEAVPAENFLINKDARSITDARLVGHKSMVTISDLLAMGFDYDKVSEVQEEAMDDDAEDNIASNARRDGILYDMDVEETEDLSQREVELFEVYVKSSTEETLNSVTKIAISKLYQVFYASGVLLSYQEVDEVPYCGSSPIPRPFMFWGDGMVDRTKSIQSARTGLLRQTFVYNDMASKPRFEYVPDNIINIRDLMSNKAGAGIAVKQLGSVQPITVTGNASGDNAGLMAQLDIMREAGTGMSFTGQGMLGEVLKAGGSTQSAAMVVTEGQMVQKKVINNMLQTAIIPLIRNIYNMMRENFSTWKVEIQGQQMEINPNEWPRLRDIQIKTPLGTNAKLEQSQKYGNLAQTLASAPQGSELAKLGNASGIKALMVKSYELMDVPDVDFYMNDDQTIQQKDQMVQMQMQLQQQMQQMQQQLQQLTQQNQVLTATASAMAQKELELKEREVAIKEFDVQLKQTKNDAEMEDMANDQLRKEAMDNAVMENMADKQIIAERNEDRKDLQTKVEIATETNLFRSN